MPFTLDVRPEVAAFALLMERQLRRNDHKGGWKDYGMDVWFVAKLTEETGELAAVLLAELDCEIEPTTEKIGSEAGDVGNLAMMIADRSGALEQFLAQWRNPHYEDTRR